MHGFLVLHAWGCSPWSVKDVVDALGAIYPDARILAPGAPGNEWFAYLTDRRGSGEDLIDSRQLRWARYRLMDLVARSGIDARSTVVIGFSQGGCLALDLAAHAEFAAVVTVVSHITYATTPEGLLCPWFALVGARDNVFPPRSWASRGLSEAVVTKCPFGHHVPDDTATGFVLRAVREALEASRRRRRAGGASASSLARVGAEKRPVKRRRA